VQLDEVLTTLQDDTRETSRRCWPSTAAASRDRRRRPTTTRIRTCVARRPPSRSTTRSTTRPRAARRRDRQRGVLGTEERDLSRTIAGLQRVTPRLGRNENVLQDNVENFNRRCDLRRREDERQRDIRELARTLPTADRAFASLNSAFPNTRAFAREILPGVRETPATIEASFPCIEQARRLLGPDELGGLARDLSPAARDLARATDAAVRFFPQQNRFAKCLDRTILPTGDIKIEDGAFTAGVENYKEFWYTLVGWRARARTSTATASTSASSPAAAPDALDRALERRHRSAGVQPGVAAHRRAARVPRQAPALQA
jgi:hypothetical protein